MKRLFDIAASLFGLVLLFPLLIIIALMVLFTSSGGAFYRQTRVGLNGKAFKLWKFRTMRVGSDKDIQLTTSKNDPRITWLGAFLRQFKIDELPQLFNVLVGEMSLVGPRPEVPEYVALYSAEQKKVLEVRPGLTDPASLAYFNENAVLEASQDPEKTYIEEVMPAKLKLNLEYLSRRNFFTDIGLILKTIGRIFS